MRRSELATAVHIPLEEYLDTSYRPDREYVDGEVIERHLGHWAHARTRALLCGWLGAHKREWNCMGASTLRVAVSPTRIRAPDLVLIGAGKAEDVLTEPSMLVIEILSPDDTYSEPQERATDYRRMGIETVWIIDPKTRTGRMSIGSAWIAADRLEVPGTPIYADLYALFARLQPA